MCRACTVALTLAISGIVICQSLTCHSLKAKLCEKMNYYLEKRRASERSVLEPEFIFSVQKLSFELGFELYVRFSAFSVKLLVT